MFSILLPNPKESAFCWNKPVLRMIGKTSLTVGSLLKLIDQMFNAFQKIVSDDNLVLISFKITNNTRNYL